MTLSSDGQSHGSGWIVNLSQHPYSFLSQKQLFHNLIQLCMISISLRIYNQSNPLDASAISPTLERLSLSLNLPLRPTPPTSHLPTSLSLFLIALPILPIILSPYSHNSIITNTANPTIPPRKPHVRNLSTVTSSQHHPRTMFPRHIPHSRRPP